MINPSSFCGCYIFGSFPRIVCLLLDPDFEFSEGNDSEMENEHLCQFLLHFAAATELAATRTIAAITFAILR